ncbi:MAG: hypothetical protein P1V97_14455 [Planctomycetota bacterium]|nr:hypothetical protein [Planctomycetota bacterium]
MTHPARTLKYLLSLILCTILGFAWGFSDGLDKHIPAHPQNTFKQPSAVLEVKLSLAQDEYRQGSSPELLIDLHSPNAPIPRDVATWLRLQLAFPGGWDSERALREPEKVMIAVSDDGRRMQILVPVNLFEHSADQVEGISLNRFSLESIGDHELRVLLKRPGNPQQSPERFRSNPIRFTVIPNNLETVQQLPTLPLKPLLTQNS